MADPRVPEICDRQLAYRTRRRRSVPLRAGHSRRQAGRAASYDAIVAAVRDARAGVIDAIATAPINKEALALAGLPWPGHTDLLAHLSGAPRVAMMFHADTLRVVLGDDSRAAVEPVPAALRSARLPPSS